MGTRRSVGVSAFDTIMLTAHVENTDVALGYRGSSATYLTERMNIKLNNKQAFSNQLIFTDAVSGPIKNVPLKRGNIILHETRPSAVSGASTLILQVSKYPKFSCHLNESSLLSSPHNLKTQQRVIHEKGLRSVFTAFPRVMPTRLHSAPHYS